MRAYLVTLVTVHNPEAFEAARRLASAATAQHGAKFLARAGMAVVQRQLEVIEGEFRPDHVNVIEYPSLEAARAWLASDEYRAAKAARARAADFCMFLLPESAA